MVKKYKTISADPPWRVELGSTWKTRFTDKARPDKQYKTMNLIEICKLQIPSAEQSHLFLWVVNQHIDWGYQVSESWGFKVWQILTWCKKGLGVGRFQCNTEHILVCRKGSRYGNPFGMTEGTHFNWERGKHSEKPEESYKLIEKISPSPRLELFARKKREGWDCIGNAISGKDIKQELEKMKRDYSGEIVEI